MVSVSAVAAACGMGSTNSGTSANANTTKAASPSSTTNAAATSAAPLKAYETNYPVRTYIPVVDFLRDFYDKDKHDVLWAGFEEYFRRRVSGVFESSADGTKIGTYTVTLQNPGPPITDDKGQPVPVTVVWRDVDKDRLKSLKKGDKLEFACAPDHRSGNLEFVACSFAD